MDRAKNDRVDSYWDMLALASAMTRDRMTNVTVLAPI
jgi:hypothetical protein